MVDSHWQKLPKAMMVRAGGRAAPQQHKSDRRIDGGSFNQAFSSEMSMQGTRHAVVQVESTDDLSIERLIAAHYTSRGRK